MLKRVESEALYELSKEEAETHGWIIIESLIISVLGFYWIAIIYR